MATGFSGGALVWWSAGALEWTVDCGPRVLVPLTKAMAGGGTVMRGTSDEWWVRRLGDLPGSAVERNFFCTWEKPYRGVLQGLAGEDRKAGSVQRAACS